jgi:hypothetical protein
MLHGTGLDSAVVDQPTDSQEYILHIVVRPNGLNRVSWDGKPLPELVKPEHNARFKETDYVGWFGAFNRSSVSVYSNARLMLFQRKPQ